MLAAEPFPKIDHFATWRTEWRGGTVQPPAGLAAGGAFRFAW
jgi:hypothetical protein